MSDSQMNDPQTSNHTVDDFDSEKERVKRFARFAAFLFVIVFAWYAFDLAAGI